MNLIDPKVLFLVHFAVTWFLVGLIWVVQVVHYPLFDWVSPERFTEFSRAHGVAITPLVGPMMVVELGLASVSWLSDWRSWPMALALGLVIFIWAVTFFVSVPLHEQLGLGFSAEAHQKLVTTNWLRTVAWSIKALLLSWLFLRSYGA